MKRILLTLAALTISCSAWAGAWKTESLGGFSTVHIYTPTSNSKIGDGKALLIVLHGCTQTANGFITAKMNEKADELGYIIAAPEAQYKQGFGCWGYWTGAPTRTGFGNDYVNIFGLIDALKQRENVDENQIYISGFSSGGAFAMETGCLAPDVFAGMGITAGPSAGTSAGGSMGPKEGTVASTVAACNSYAGTNASHFATQLFNGAAGTTDTLVNQGYAPQNTDAMAQIYGVSKQSGTNTVTGGSGATETVWENNRVTMLTMNGVGHQWSGGAGASGSYINSASINYGAYLMDFFTDNNIRAEGGGGNDDDNTAPTLSVTAPVSGQSIIVGGTVTDPDGDSVTATVSLKNKSTGSVQGPYNLTLNASGGFEKSFDNLADGSYLVTVIATDDMSAATTKTASATVSAGSDDGDDDGDDGSTDGGGDDGTDPSLNSCDSVTGTVTDLLESNPDLITKNGWFYYTSGDNQQVWSYSGDSYTVYIDEEGLGYLEDPMTCEPEVIPDGDDDDGDTVVEDGDDDVIVEDGDDDIIVEDGDDDIIVEDGDDDIIVEDGDDDVVVEDGDDDIIIIEDGDDDGDAGDPDEQNTDGDGENVITVSGGSFGSLLLLGGLILVAVRRRK